MEHEPSVVVTGAGVATSLGISVDDVWQRCVRGDSGIRPFRRFNPEGFGCTASAETPELGLASRLRSPKNAKFIGRSVECGMYAAKEAVESSRVDLAAVDPYRIAIYTGSGQTGFEGAEFFRALEFARADDDDDRNYANLGGRASRLIDRYFSLRTLANAGVALLSIEFGAKGASDNFVQGDTASALAIGAAVRALSEGRSDIALAGGYDSLLDVSTYLAYDKAGLLSYSAPDRAYRPFDRDRDGIVLGEGAAFLVLERASDARRRGAVVLGEIVGVGTATDPVDAPDTKTAAVAARAIADAVRGEAIDFVVAHGIGTGDGDRCETGIIDALLGPAVPVTALKSHTGYVGAATSVVELVLALCAARARLVPPIARHDAADSDCRLALVTGAARPLATASPVALCLAWSWFGQCAAIAVRAGDITVV